MGRPIAVAVAAALSPAVGVLTGCGLGAGHRPGNVTLTVTRDFGARQLHRADAPKVVGGETVMALLMRNVHASTRYGGGFVQSIDGTSAGHSGGHPVDWFYYVNGIQAAKGAADTPLHGGDRVWWDLHDWSGAESVPAVVGSFPQPFVSGSGGKRFPVTMYCMPTGSAACRTVSSRLRGLGVNVSLGALGTDEPSTLRVIVGPWAAVRTDPAASLIQTGPQASGVFARFDPRGTALTLLGTSGAAVRTLNGPAGLVAATNLPNEAPTWLVTGTDSAATQSAARSLTAAALRDHFAVAVAGRNVQPVPIGS